MHDVLVHYLEVNFPEIAEQLAHARGREPSNEERAAAAERLRELIRRLRRGSEGAGAPPHTPRAPPAGLFAGFMGDLSPDERAVLDRFFDLFARSMQRTQAAIASEPAPPQPPPPAAPSAVAERPPEPATETAVSADEAVVEEHPVEPAAAVEPVAPIEPATPPPVAEAPVAEAPPEPVTNASEAPPAVAEAPLESQAARLVPEQMAGALQTILLAAAQQALDLLQVDASQVYTLGDQQRFVLRAGVPTESLAAPEGVTAISSGLLRRALEHNEVFTVEDLAAEEALFKYYEQRRQRDPEDAGQLIPQLRSMTEEILAGARNVLQSLRPKTIRSEGLMASVLKLVDQFGRVNLVETNVNIRGEENTISAGQKAGIFQVLQESLSNVRKHSQARNLWVVVDLSSSPWVLTVRDDGRGFDVRRVAEDPKKIGSYGLVGMRERAELIGGALEIVSQSLEGTLVTLIGPAERSE